jgi:hypothetical protein
MKTVKQTPKTLSNKLRILIGMMSIPSLVLAALLISTAIDKQWDSIDAFEVIYALVGIFAAYIALTGKRFF